MFQGLQISLTGIRAAQAGLDTASNNIANAGTPGYTRQRIDLVLGGFHRAGKAMEKRIGDTVRDLKTRIQPRFLAPGHCTGWRAKAELAAAFAPSKERHLETTAQGRAFVEATRAAWPRSTLGASPCWPQPRRRGTHEQSAGPAAAPAGASDTWSRLIRRPVSASM